jgi:hypothetical protein
MHPFLPIRALGGNFRREEAEMKLEDGGKKIRIELNLKEATMIWSLLNDEVFHKALDTITQDVFETWYDTKKVGYVLAMGINSILQIYEVDKDGNLDEISGEIDLQSCVEEINKRTNRFRRGGDKEGDVERSPRR